MAVENRLNSAVVHNPKTGESESVVFRDELPAKERFYFSDGNHTNTETGKTVAKQSHMSDGLLYYIKFGIDGMYDPLGMYSAGSQNIECKRFGKPVWDYRKVKENVFQLYIKYLLTKNKTYYLQAVRENKNN